MPEGITSEITTQLPSKDNPSKTVIPVSRHGATVDVSESTGGVTKAYLEKDNPKTSLTTNTEGVKVRQDLIDDPTKDHRSELYVEALQGIKKTQEELAQIKVGSSATGGSRPLDAAAYQPPQLEQSPPSPSSSPVRSKPSEEEYTAILKDTPKLNMDNDNTKAVEKPPVQVAKKTPEIIKTIKKRKGLLARIGMLFGFLGGGGLAATHVDTLKDTTSPSAIVQGEVQLPTPEEVGYTVQASQSTSNTQ